MDILFLPGAVPAILPLLLRCGYPTTEVLCSNLICFQAPTVGEAAATAGARWQMRRGGWHPEATILGLEGQGEQAREQPAQAEGQPGGSP